MYLQAAAGTVIEELQRRGFVLHYVVDATEGGANLQTMVDYLPRSSTCWDDGAGPDASRQRRTVNSTAAGR